MTCAEPLTFQQAVLLATDNQPLLDSQSAAIAAAQHNAVTAAQRPDPKLKLGVINLPTSGTGAYSLGQDFMTMRMIGVMQEFPREEKLRLRGIKAEIETEKEIRELDVLRRTLERETGLAWLDSYYAAQALNILQQLQQQTKSELESQIATYRVGRTSQADVLAVRSAIDSLKDRELDLVRQRDQAQVMLVRWIGDVGKNPIDVELPNLPPLGTSEILTERLANHPHLDLMGKQIALAETDVALEQKNRSPDWSVELSYNQRGAAFPNMVSLQFGIDLPIFPEHRQNQNLASKNALLEKTRAQRDDNARTMRADIASYYVNWGGYQKRSEHFEKNVLPTAQARIDAALAAYRAGQGSFSAILEAQRAFLELQLQRLSLSVDATRAQVQLHYFE
jgi:outer membrane protein TolC